MAADDIWSYHVVGTAAEGMTWEVEGMVISDFPDAASEAMKHAFMKLTRGEAIYGHPGVGGCQGPYKVKVLTVRLVDPRDDD
jgi:hypothetical protein